MKRIHVFYSGTVQGVGFRFTAKRSAGRHGVSGWVKNLPDGRVEAVCEGGEEALRSFLEDMKEGLLGRCIETDEVEWASATAEFTGFEIRF